MSIEERIEKLERTMKDHLHLGVDGSKEFDGSTSINAKEVEIHGSGAVKEGQLSSPFVMYDGTPEDGKNKRLTGISVASLHKDTVSEQVQGSITSGKNRKFDNIIPLNKTDFDDVNFSQMIIGHNPQSTQSMSGPSVFPPFSFLWALRTPYIEGSGLITNGGTTLTDNTADFKNSLAGSVLYLSNLEARKVVSNTSNEITIDGTWSSASGEYGYQLVTPIFLGAAQYPFTRLYVGEDIRLGYGSSGGSQVQYIKWGNGSPEGVVTANIGSLYLRRDGSTNTTLYIKESGTGSSGWIAK